MREPALLVAKAGLRPRCWRRRPRSTGRSPARAWRGRARARACRWSASAISRSAAQARRRPRWRLLPILKAAGCRPAFLTRGYGGRLAGPVRSIRQRIARRTSATSRCCWRASADAVVARDRVAGARCIEARGADVIVMDDGFQNPALDKTCRLWWSTPAGASATAGCFRPGRCARRSTPSSNTRTRSWRSAQGAARRWPDRGRPCDRHSGPARPAGARSGGGRGAAGPAGAGLCGDRRSGQVFRTLADAGIAVRERRAFPDHHRYRRDEALDLLAAGARGLDRSVTTEKDHGAAARRARSRRARRRGEAVSGGERNTDDAAAFRRSGAGGVCG